MTRVIIGPDGRSSIAGPVKRTLKEETIMKADTNLALLACSLLGLAAALLFYGASLT